MEHPIEHEWNSHLITFLLRGPVFQVALCNRLFVKKIPISQLQTFTLALRKTTHLSIAAVFSKAMKNTGCMPARFSCLIRDKKIQPMTVG